MIRMGRVKPLFGVCLVASIMTPLACRPAAKSSDTAPAANNPQPDCAADKADQCNQVEATIADLQARRTEARDANDAVALSRVLIELNHQTDLLDLLRHDETDPAAYAALESKYGELGRQFEADLANRKASTAPANPGHDDPATHPAVHPDGSDGHVPLLPLSPLVYAPAELSAVNEVMKDLGDLYIDVNDASQSQTVQVDMPWAGYWYPFRGDDLFAKDDAPLAKLDKIAAGRHVDAHAADWEKARYHPLSFETWEGLCAAWATASVKVPEPKHVAVVDGVSFSIADQKALLTKSFEAFPNKVYGNRYRDDAESDGLRQDIRPEAFHRFVERFIGELHRPFLVDDDPGTEVWTKPVYRMHWTMKKDPTKGNAVIVNADPWMTHERDGIDEDDDVQNVHVHEHETDRLTTVNEDKSGPSYRYRLYFDPHAVRDGKYRVIAGEWLEDAHPDIISVPSDSDAWQSTNDELNKEMSLVKEIIAAGQTP